MTPAPPPPAATAGRRRAFLLSSLRPPNGKFVLGPPVETEPPVKVFTGPPDHPDAVQTAEPRAKKKKRVAKKETGEKKETAAKDDTKKDGAKTAATPKHAKQRQNRKSVRRTNAARPAIAPIGAGRPSLFR